MTEFAVIVTRLKHFCSGDLTNAPIEELSKVMDLCSRNKDLQITASLLCEQVQDVFQLLQKSLMKVGAMENPTETRSLFLSLMMKLAVCNNELPQSLRLDHIDFRGTDPDYHSKGAFGKVYKALKSDDGQLVAIKVPFEVNKALLREILLWYHIEHEHILGFLGVCTFEKTYPSLVSPWMEKGDLHHASKTLPLCSKYLLLSQIASALDYLHNQEPSIIHEDVRAANILISDNDQALLADFGITRIDDKKFAQMSSMVQHGNPRWLAPELLFGHKGQLPKPRPGEDPRVVQDDEEPLIKASAHTDVWSFGMTIIEVLTDKVPFHEKSCTEAYVIMMIGERKLPVRPQIRGDIGEIAPSDELWVIISSCWAEDPKDRPGALTLQRELEKAAQVDVYSLNEIIMD